MVEAKIIGQAIFNCKLFIVYIYMKSKQLKRKENKTAPLKNTI